MQLQTIDLPPLAFRAAVGAVGQDSRTVEVIFSTGAEVPRYDWRSGQRFLERLSLKPEHVMLRRLNAGAPLLNSHSFYSLSSQMGVVETASVDGKRGLAQVRFSKRPDVEPFYQDVLDKVIRSVSVGYKVYRYEEETTRRGELPLRTATAWEPWEISLVPLPEDFGAQTRGAQPSATFPCVIVRGARPDADRVRDLRLARARYSVR